ncbi:MAG: hypothetical protein R6W77_09760 [Trueperaceae bacterium]
MIGFTHATHRILRERMRDIEREARHMRAATFARKSDHRTAVEIGTAIRDQESKIRALFAHRRHVANPNS